jgi:hypothetical protein
MRAWGTAVFVAIPVIRDFRGEGKRNITKFLFPPRIESQHRDPNTLSSRSRFSTELQWDSVTALCNYVPVMQSPEKRKGKNMIKVSEKLR